MSTRAIISYRRPDGRFTAVYLHFDGYPERTGAILQQHYNTPELAESLVSGGDIRTFDDRTLEPERYSNSNQPTTMPTRPALLEFARNCGAEYPYLYENNRWECLKL